MADILDATHRAEELIAQHVEARGGWDAIMAIKTLRQSGNVQMQTPNVLVTISGERMRPDLLRIRFSVGEKSGQEGWDGERAWELNGFRGMEQAEYVEGSPALALKRGAEFDGPMVGYKEKGYTAEYLGEDEVDGREQWVVRVVMSDGNAIDHYLDKASMLVTKTRAMRAVHGGDEAMTETQYSDYREVAGVLFPFRSWELAKDGAHNEVFTWELMEANVGLDKEHFEMPR